MIFRVVGYDPASCQLDVEFEGDDVYEFYDVPEAIYNNMVSSGNPKEFLDSKIWNKYEHKSNWSSVGELLEYVEKNFCTTEEVAINSALYNGDTPLHLACSWGDVGAVEKLLHNGALPDAHGDMGCTPLFRAVSNSYVRCAKLLLEHGALLDSQNDFNITPRERAYQIGNARMLQLFLDHQRPEQNEGR